MLTTEITMNDGITIVINVITSNKTFHGDHITVYRATAISGSFAGLVGFGATPQDAITRMYQGIT